MKTDCILSENLSPALGGYAMKCFEGKQWRHHRLVWTQTFGPIPKGLCVLHRCDVRNCINPEHLFLGTRPENSVDMVQKGRMSWGEKHPTSKLTEKDVLFIRSSELSTRKLGAMFGVNQMLISKIKRRKLWRHL